MKKTSRIAAVIALALLATGCGDRGPDPSTAPLSDPGAPRAAETSPDAGDWGSLKAVCGPSEGGGEVAGGDDAQGATAERITLGTVADPGFAARPGLNQELFDAGDAFVAWCNAAGGINGKELVLNNHDAKLTDYQPAMDAACSTDFALVGGGAVQDNLWETTGAACGLIDIAGFAVTGEKAGRSGQSPQETRTVQPVPNPADQFPVAAVRLLDEAFPDAKGATGYLYADFQTLKRQFDKESQALESIGHDTRYKGVYGINGEANWTPFATAMESKGVTFMAFIGEGTHAASLEQAMTRVGFVPPVRYYDGNFYDPAFIDAAGSSADGAFVGSVFIPLEEAATHPATQQYIDVLEDQGGKQAVLGIQSMSAWLLFAQVAKSCDLADDLTRTCILKEAATVTDWTGGGMHAPTNPARNEPSTCQMVLQIQDRKFTRWAPTDEDFACDPAGVAQVEPGT